MALYRTEDIDILEPEITDFSIESTGKREIVWNDPDETDDEHILYLAQNDTGSTKIIFDIDRVINGNDMYQCDMVHVHYINVGSSTQKSPDIYDVTDLQVVQAYEECAETDGTLIEIDDLTTMRYIYGLNSIDFNTTKFQTSIVDPDSGVTTSRSEKVVYNSSTKKYEITSVTTEDNEANIFVRTIHMDRNALALLVYYHNSDDLMYSFVVKYTGPSGNTSIFAKNKCYKYMDQEEQKLRFSWLINSNTTKYPGTVQFAIHFIRSADGYNPNDETTYGKIQYTFVTNVCDDIEVFATLDNSSSTESTSSELLAKWRDQLMFTPIWTQNLQAEEGVEDLSVLTLKREWDGATVSSPESLRGPQGIQGIQGEVGPQGPVGATPKMVAGSVSYGAEVTSPTLEIDYPNPDDLSQVNLDFYLPAGAAFVKTLDKVEGEVNGETVTAEAEAGFEQLQFFVGTKENCDKVSNINKAIFAIATDDTRLDDLADNVDNFKELVKTCQETVNEVKSDATEIKNRIDLFPNQPGRVFKYQWTDAAVEDTSNHAFSAVAEPDSTTGEWIPKLDGTVVYEYYKDSDGDGVPDEEPFETEIVAASSDSLCPSNYAETGPLWQVYPHSPYNFIKFSGDFTDVVNNVSGEVVVTSTYNNLLSASVTVGSVTKKFDNIVDGSTIVFEDSTADLNHPDRYNGYSIKRVAILKKESNVLHGDDGWSVYFQTYVQADPNWDANQTDPQVLKAIANDEKTFYYDPIKNREEVVKTVRYGYSIGAPALLTTITYESCEDPETGVIGGPFDDVFTFSCPDFLDYLKREGYELTVSDYLIDANDELYKIANPIGSSSNSIQLIRLSRETKKISNNTALMAAFLKKLFTVSETYSYPMSMNLKSETSSLEEDEDGKSYYVYHTDKEYTVVGEGFHIDTSNYLLTNVSFEDVDEIDTNTYGYIAEYLKDYITVSPGNEGKPNDSNKFTIRFTFHMGKFLEDNRLTELQKDNIEADAALGLSCDVTGITVTFIADGLQDLE